MSKSFLDTIILLGAIQGFITSTLLFTSRKNGTSARLLGWIVLLMAMANINLYLDGIHLPRATFFRILFNVIPLVIIMPLGPLIYFYTIASTQEQFRLSKRDRLHFLPIVIDILPQLIVLFFLVAVSVGFNRKYGPAIGLFIDEYNVYSDIPRWISVTAYVLLSLRHLKRQQANAGNPFQNANRRWLETFIKIFMIFQAIWLVYLVPYVIPTISDRMMSLVDWYPVYVPLTMLIYFAGIRGYIQAQQVAGKEKKEAVPATLPPEVAAHTISQLQAAMEKEKLYLDPALTLGTVAARTGISAKTISATLNQHLGKSFNEFVNEYRIAEIKKRLIESGAERFTIAGLAYECGFNSQPTFQRAFKAVTGVTPTEFLSTHSHQQQ